jgi:hypothetical protein
MDFIEIEMDGHKMLISIYEIVYIREMSDSSATISLKGHNMSMTVTTSYEEIIEQLTGIDDTTGGITFSKAN